MGNLPSNSQQDLPDSPPGWSPGLPGPFATVIGNEFGGRSGVACGDLRLPEWGWCDGLVPRFQTGFREPVLLLVAVGYGRMRACRTAPGE
ncbi:hypothetical protein GCM10023235_05640 [Kitasatospora terrestris]|uniref:Uncharacterized protein n=1 Tax=Kitasatospora terrestris TaxID=258051 RepID=A0ABP9D9D4_9ACTN